MASPTRWFRKHSKVLIVILAVFAMAIFGLGDAIFQFTRPNTQGEFKNEVIATWGNGQEITRVDLQNLMERHFQVQRFLEKIETTAFELKKDEYRPMAQRISPIQGDERVSRTAIDGQLINRFIFARKAEKEGLIYTDAMIDDYLDMLSGRIGFSNVQLTQMNREVNSNRVSYEMVRRHLRQELMAQQMQMFSNAGYQVIPNPSEGVELFQKYTELVDCEVLPVDVDQFSNLSEKPSNIDLKKLYDQGKFDYPDSTGRRPGFKRPNRAAIQYIMADAETFTQNEINKLTDEQVQAEYDRLVAEKNDLVMEVIPESETQNNQNEEPEIKLPEIKPEGEPENSTESDSNENPPTETSATEPSTPNSEPEKKEPANDEPGTSEPGNLEPGNSEPGLPDDPSRDEGSQSVKAESSAKQTSHYVSLQDGEPDSPEPNNQEPGSQDPTPGSDEPPPETPVPDEPETPMQEPSETPAETEPAETPAGTEPSEVQQEKTEQPSPPVTPEAEANPPAQADPDLPSLPAQLPGQPAAQDDDLPLLNLDSLFTEDRAVEKRPRPLASVADTVKRNMVRDAVQLQIEQSVKSVEEELDLFQSDLMAWESISPETRGEQPKVDYQAIANRLGLLHGETEMVDYEAFSQTTIGQAIAPMNMGGQPRLVSVAERIFGDFDRINKFASERQTDFRNGSQYVYWVKDKQEATIVPFEECKEDVEKFWKRTKMVELAIARANEIAREADAKKQPLSELYGENVSRTGEFSWSSSLSNTGYGDPNGVKNPGSDFMKSVFELQANQVGVAVNDDQSIVYVVRMVSERKGIDALGADYVDTQYLPKKTIPREVLQLSQQYAQEYNFDWTRELHDEMGLKFLGR